MMEGLPDGEGERSGAGSTAPGSQPPDNLAGLPGMNDVSQALGSSMQKLEEELAALRARRSARMAEAEQQSRVRELVQHLSFQVPEWFNTAFHGRRFSMEHNGTIFDVQVPEGAIPGQAITIQRPVINPYDVNPDHMMANTGGHHSEFGFGSFSGCSVAQPSGSRKEETNLLTSSFAILTAMGFTVEQSVAACMACDGDVNRAVSAILDGHGTEVEPIGKRSLPEKEHLGTDSDAARRIKMKRETLKDAMPDVEDSIASNLPGPKRQKVPDQSETRKSVERVPSPTKSSRAKPKAQGKTNQSLEPSDESDESVGTITEANARRLRWELGVDSIQRDVGVALFIKPRWCEEILSGRKTWEIRGCISNKREVFAIAVSGEKMLAGSARIVDCIHVADRNDNGELKPLEDDLDLRLPENVAKHRIALEDLEIIDYNKVYAWVLEEPRRFRQPIPFQAKSGSVIWSRISVIKEQRTESVCL